MTNNTAATTVENTSTIIDWEDVIYEQVRNPSTLEPIIDPSTGRPRTRVSSIDNPEHYKRLMEDLRKADKIRDDAKAAEERESKAPPTVMTRLMPHPKTGEINYWSFVVERSTGREILLEGRDRFAGEESLRKQYSGKFHCSYCSKNFFTEDERKKGI
jgi:hypothetical protein